MGIPVKPWTASREPSLTLEAPASRLQFSRVEFPLPIPMVLRTILAVSAVADADPFSHEVVNIADIQGGRGHPVGEAGIDGGDDTEISQGLLGECILTVDSRKSNVAAYKAKVDFTVFQGQGIGKGAVGGA